MINRLVVIFFLVFFSAAKAQQIDSIQLTKTASWGVNFANVGLSNWAAGGESSVALGTVLNSKMVRKKGLGSWTNQFDFALGGAQVGDKDFRKTDDNIILQTKYTQRFSNKFRFSAIGVFRTQLLNGFKFRADPLNEGEELSEKISGFVSPGYLSLNLGFDYQPSDALSVSLAPTSGKFTFVSDQTLADAGAFGVSEGEHSRAEFGANLLVAMDVPVMENINWKSSLNLFSSYDEFGTIDVNWESLFVMKINKWFNSSLGTQLIYDKDILIAQEDGSVDSAVQFKHVLNFGLNFALF
ncbi:MAG: DUF3078 domain-containing protein [Bacteroidetes bacterium]|nr:DUF3078 domain-containing protein [Bacteroidota bacterium]